MIPWQTVPWLRGAVITAVVLLGTGLLLARPDVGLLGLPVVAAIVLGSRRPQGTGTITVSVEPRDAGGAIRLTVQVEASRAADLVVVGLSGYGEPDRFVVVHRQRARRLPVVLPVLHSGPQEVLQVQARLIAAGTGAALQVDPVAVSVVVAAAGVPVGGLPLPPSASFRPGGHRAPRAGDGIDFRDLHPFMPGDRLRRIDWRATARQPSEADLVVRRTDASAEAVAVVLLDSRVDVGAVVAEWSTNRPARKGLSALDVAREATLSLTRAYLDAGDRVAFHDLCRPDRGVRSGGGRRQGDRIAALVDALPAQPTRSLVLPPLPPSAVVLLLSTYLDEEPLRLAGVLAAGGSRVIAVDVLPPPDLGDLDRRRRIAARIVLLEREDRLRRLAGTGVPVVPWASPDRDIALRTAARPRRRR